MAHACNSSKQRPNRHAREDRREERNDHSRSRAMDHLSWYMSSSGYEICCAHRVGNTVQWYPYTLLWGSGHWSVAWCLHYSLSHRYIAVQCTSMWTLIESCYIESLMRALLSCRHVTSSRVVSTSCSQLNIRVSDKWTDGELYLEVY